MSATRAILKRIAALPRRELVWTGIRREARARGFSPRELERFYHYLSIHLGLERQRYANPLQQPPNYFPGLDARPLHDAAQFSWTAQVPNRFATIRQELLEYSARRDLDEHPQDIADRGRWNVLYFYAGGREVAATRRACPQTAALIDSVPGSGRAGQAYLSVVRAGTHIKHHFGPTNTRLRCHIGLVVPQECRIRVGDETYRWREGECLIFDDSFDHEVWNDSDTDRVVLIVDFWHPELMPAETWAIDTARQLRFGLKDILHA